MPFLALLFLAVLGLAAVTGGYVMRRHRQVDMDRRHVSWEIKPPWNLTEIQATALFEGLTGLFQTAGAAGSLNGRPSFTWEVWGQASGISFLLSFPGDLTDIVRGHLRSAVPAIHITVVERPTPDFIAVSNLVRPKDNVVEADAFKVPTLLNSLSRLEEGEVIVVQFVVTTTGARLHEADAKPFMACGRLAVAAANDARARQLMRGVVTAYRTLHMFATEPQPVRRAKDVQRRTTPHVWTAELSARDLAVIGALPTGNPTVPGLSLQRGRRLAPEPAIPREGTVLGTASYIGAERPIAIDVQSRLRHTLVLGSQGSGKTTLLLNMLLQDADAGYPVILLDPHGELTHDFLDRMPPHRHQDVVVWNVQDVERPIGFNVMAGEDPYVVMSNLMVTMNRLYGIEHAAPRAWNLLRPTLLSVAALGWTLLEVPRLIDPGPAGLALRSQVSGMLDNQALTDYWLAWDLKAPKERAEEAAPLIHRLSSLYLYPHLRRSIGQNATGIDLREVMDERKILVVPITRGAGEELAQFVSALLLMRIWQTAQARPLGSRDPVMVYVDEMASQMKGSPVPFDQLFSEARKFGIAWTVANQTLRQLKDAGVYDDVMANVKNKVIRPTAAGEAVALAQQFGPTVTPHDIDALDSFEAMAQLSVDERYPDPVTMYLREMPPSNGTAAALLAASAARYGVPADEVERTIRRRSRLQYGAAATVDDQADETAHDAAPLHDPWGDGPEAA